MTGVSQYNLASPTGISVECDLQDPYGWYERELITVGAAAVRHTLLHVCRHLDDFVRWPKRPVLLWSTCTRIPEPGTKQRIHVYPAAVRSVAKEQGVPLDTRPNGPAIAAFLLAGGDRPRRLGSQNSWSVHHIYSGKFPYVGRSTTLHASKECLHFSQSAGLVALHPIADAIADDVPAFTWLLRAEAFKRFSYDPDGVFSEVQDAHGFAHGRACGLIY